MGSRRGRWVRVEVYPSLQGHHERQYKLGDLPTEADFFQSCGWEVLDQSAEWKWEKDSKIFFSTCMSMSVCGVCVHVCACQYTCMQKPNDNLVCSSGAVQFYTEPLTGLEFTKQAWLVGLSATVASSVCPLAPALHMCIIIHAVFFYDVVGD